jgi:hypothetical protein
MILVTSAGFIQCKTEYESHDYSFNFEWMIRSLFNNAN